MKASIFSILILWVAYSQRIIAQNNINLDKIKTHYYFFDEKCKYTSVKNKAILFMDKLQNDDLNEKYFFFFGRLLWSSYTFAEYSTIFSYQEKKNKKIYNIYSADCYYLKNIIYFDTYNSYTCKKNPEADTAFRRIAKDYLLTLSPQSAFVLDSITSKCGDCETWHLYKKIISRKHKNRIKYTPLFRVTYENIELNINILNDIYTDENYW